MISDLAKHQTETRSRSPVSRNAKLKRETDLRLRKTPSRRTKPIKISRKRQNEAGNGVNSSKSRFPPRETGKIFRKTVLCDGKPVKCLGKRFCAAGRRLKISEIDFPPREMRLFLRKTFSAAESPYAPPHKPSSAQFVAEQKKLQVETERVSACNFFVT